MGGTNQNDGSGPAAWPGVSPLVMGHLETLEDMPCLRSYRGELVAMAIHPSLHQHLIPFWLCCGPADHQPCMCSGGWW